MNFLSFLSGLAAPNDLWSILINWIKGGVGNLGWTILLVTVMVKAITLPLDFVSKLQQKKQTLIQQKCAPETEKLKKKFGNDRQRLQVQTNAVYKREGLKMGTSCIVMLVNMILTMVIFFTFFGSLRDNSAYEAIQQYERVEESYSETFYAEMMEAYPNIESVEQAEVWIGQYQDKNLYIAAHEGTNEEDWLAFVDANKNTIEAITKTASDAAIATWHEVKADWLWVNNIWVADATISPFPSYDELLSMAKSGGKEYKTYVEENINKDNYNSIAGLIQTNETKNNGFYILAVMAGVITYLSQLISERHNKLKNKKAKLISDQANPTGTAMKVMKFMLPVLMITFVLTSSASFGIYMLASNVSSIVFGELVSLIVNAMTKKKQLEVEEVLAKEADRLIRKGKLQG